MLLRSFTIQGSWNYETLIGAGFAYTILPALRHLHGQDGEALERAMERHEELFNSHPYFVTIAAGAVSELEAIGTDPAVIVRFKTALRGSLGSMGDRMIWSTWRPMSILLGLVLLLAGFAWWIAVTAFLIVYNTVHLAVRVRGLQIGSRAGFDVGRVLKDSPLQSFIEAASKFTCFLIGAAVVLAVAPVYRDPTASMFAGSAIVLGAVLGTRSRRVMIAILAGVAALALAFGVMGYGA